MREDAVPLVRRGGAEQHPVEQPEIAHLAPVPHEPFAAPAGQRWTPEVPGQGGDFLRQFHRQPKGIAGGRMEEPACQAEARNRIANRPEALRIAADQDRQNPGFLTQFRSAQAALCGKAADPFGKGVDGQVRAVAVIGVLHQHPVRRHGQDIDEAVTVQLRQVGVHDRGAVRFCRLGLEFDPDEFLPGQVQPRHRTLRSARIDHGAGGKALAPRQRDAIGV